MCYHAVTMWDCELELLFNSQISQGNNKAISWIYFCRYQIFSIEDNIYIYIKCVVSWLRLPLIRAIVSSMQSKATLISLDNNNNMSKGTPVLFRYTVAVSWARPSDFTTCVLCPATDSCRFPQCLKFQ